MHSNSRTTRLDTGRRRQTACLPSGGCRGLDGLYVCSTHSGITLAPVLGALGTEEILSGDRPGLLLPFSPDRLMEKA